MIDVEGIEHEAFVKNIIPEQSWKFEFAKAKRIQEEENDDFKSDKNSCPAFLV